MDSLDVNDMCKGLVTNLNRHFCAWRNHTNAHNQRNNYTVMKLLRNGNSKAKDIKQKSNSGYRTYQAQLMGWMHLIILTRIIHS